MQGIRGVKDGHYSPENPFKFAVIGCGLMGCRHTEILQGTPRTTVKCAFDKDPKRASEFKEKYGIPVMESYEEILKRDDVDGILICLPSSLHSEYGIPAAEAGKHIVTEKPIDIDPGGATALIDACRDSGVLLTIISQNRFHEGAFALKRAIEQGIIGRPVMARVSVHWIRDDRYYQSSDWRGRWSGEGGGVLMNQGIHYIDLLLWLLGEVDGVMGVTRTFRDTIETEDIGAALFRLKNGCIASITVSTSTFPGFPERLEIYGEDAACIIERGKVAFYKSRSDTPLPEVSFPLPEPADLLPKYIPFQRQYNDFLDALDSGRKPLVRPEEALGVIKSVLAIYESVHTKSEISPAEIASTRDS